MKLPTSIFVCVAFLGISVATRADEISRSNSAAAASSQGAKALLTEFVSSYAVAKVCAYRVDALTLYYVSEYERALRQAAPGKMAKDDMARLAGAALVAANTYTDQLKDKKLTAQQCADVRKAVDQQVPPGYEQ